MVAASNWFLDLERFGESQVASLKQDFANAMPCHFVVLDDILTDRGIQAVEDFPPFDWSGWHRFEDAYQARKVTFADLDRMPGSMRPMFWELNGPRFLGFLERVTGASHLVSDPYLKGGGLHCSGPGGVLAPHSDFHRYHELKLNRRFNTLIYLNEGWTLQDGGALQFFHDEHAQDLALEIEPVLGRCVIFQTDHGSVHGFTSPVGADRYRRSLATYYYTSEETQSYSGDLLTYWRHHSDNESFADRANMIAFRSFSKAAQAFSIAAHRFNPTLRRARSEAGDS